METLKCEGCGCVPWAAEHEGDVVIRCQCREYVSVMPFSCGIRPSQWVKEGESKGHTDSR